MTAQDYEDELQSERIYVAGLPNSESILSTLQGQTGVEARDLVGSRELGSASNGVPRSRLAGVLGALV